MRDGDELEAVGPVFQIRRSSADEIHDEVARVPVVRGRQLEHELVIGRRAVRRHAHGSGMLGRGIVNVPVYAVEVSRGLRVDLRVRIEIESFEFQIVHHVRGRSANPVRFQMERGGGIRSPVCRQIRSEGVLDGVSETYRSGRDVEFRGWCGHSHSKVPGSYRKRSRPGIELDDRIDDPVPPGRAEYRPRRRFIGNRQSRSKRRITGRKACENEEKRGGGKCGALYGFQFRCSVFHKGIERDYFATHPPPCGQM